MTEQQPFIRPDGTLPDWLHFTEEGRPRIEPDKYGALRLLVAAAGAGSVDEKGAEVDRILLARPAFPLVNGLIFWGLALAQAIWKAAEQLRTFALQYSMEEDEEP